MKPPVYFIDGEFTTCAKIPVDDRGFYFADSVYEVIRAKNKKPYFLKEHIKRLKRGLRELKIIEPSYLKDIEKIVNEALERLNVYESSIYIQITRGKEQRHHLPKEGITPTFLLIASEFKPLSHNLLKNGVPLIFYEDIRWGRCDIKTTMLLPNVMAKLEARERGYFDAVFYKNGIITESTSSSFFAVKDKKLITHPKDTNILPSITREVVIEKIAPNLGMEVVKRPLKVEEISEIDGAFLAGTTYDILPVNKIENIDFRVPDTILEIQKSYLDLVDEITK